MRKLEKIEAETESIDTRLSRLLKQRREIPETDVPSFNVDRSEDMKKLHLRGDHADWPQKPSMAWQLLSEESYSSRAPLIPREELQASAVHINGVLVLLHKRRCPEAALHGDVAVPWCQECAESLGQPNPVMPRLL